MLTVGAGIVDLALFKDLALFLSRFSYSTQLYRPFFNGACEPAFDTLSAHELAWCRVIVELPHHEGGLGITPLPASGMAAFYSAITQMVSWLSSLPHASEWVAGQMLMRLTLLLRDATTTVLALFPFLRSTFSLLCVFCRMRKMAMLLLVRRYLRNVRSQNRSRTSGCCMSRCCKIRLRIACVMCTCFIKPNRCPCLMRTLPCVAICHNATTRRAASSHVFLSPLPRQCGARWAAHDRRPGRQTAAMRRAPRRQSWRTTMLPSFISSSGSPTILPSLLSRMCHATA
jgi:hypothetical protein